MARFSHGDALRPVSRFLGLIGVRADFASSPAMAGLQAWTLGRGPL